MSGRRQNKSSTRSRCRCQYRCQYRYFICKFRPTSHRYNLDNLELKRFTVDSVSFLRAPSSNTPHSRQTMIRLDNLSLCDNSTYTPCNLSQIHCDTLFTNAPIVMNRRRPTCLNRMCKLAANLCKLSIEIIDSGPRHFKSSIESASRVSCKKQDLARAVRSVCQYPTAYQHQLSPKTNPSPKQNSFHRSNPHTAPSFI